ncbi:MAG: ABC transporter ATP-binding protein [Vicinamibacterales bacterium]
MKRALRYVVPYWRPLGVVLALSLVSTALSLYLPYLTRELVDRALVGRDLSSLRRVVFLFAAAGLAGFAINVIAGLRYTETSARILFDMRLALYEHLQRLSPRFYARTRLGDIVSRLNNDIGEIQRVAAEAALAWVGNILFLAGTVAMLAWLDLRLFVVAIAMVPPSVWALVVYRRRLESRVRVLRERSADIGSFLIETLQGMRLVVSSNAQSREVSRFRRVNDAFIEALMAMQRATYLSGGLPGVLLSLGTAGVFLYGGSRVIEGTISLGTLAAFMAYQMRLMGPIQALMGLYAGVATARVSWGRVVELLDTRPEVEESASPVALDRVRGEIALERVTVSFDRGAPVLDEVSLHVRAGEVVAVMGTSGSGKSTLADLLLRLVEPDAGRVLVDGCDIRTLRLADLRRHVVLAEQSPFIFHATLGENIRYARPSASHDDVTRAAAAAGLDELVRTWPRGYETIVGERGLALSAGERQRVAIARALLADPAVLILDEPTAPLDRETERAVTDGFERVMRGRTTILITHRPELAARADRVVVLDAGSARLQERSGGPPAPYAPPVGA